MGITAVSKIYVGEGEEEMSVHSSVRQLKNTRGVFLSGRDFKTRQKQVIVWILNERLWNSLSGHVEDAMALHQVLKGFGEIAGRKIPLTSTQIL